MGEAIRDLSRSVSRIVNDDRQEESELARHILSSVNRQLPLPSEISFEPRFRIGGNDGHEQSTVADLLPNLLVPGIAAAQFLTVEPDLDASRAERVRNPLRRRRILGCVAQKDGTRGCRHRLLFSPGTAAPALPPRRSSGTPPPQTSLPVKTRLKPVRGLFLRSSRHSAPWPLGQACTGPRATANRLCDEGSPHPIQPGAPGLMDCGPQGLPDGLRRPALARSARLT